MLARWRCALEAWKTYGLFLILLHPCIVGLGVSRIATRLADAATGVLRSHASRNLLRCQLLLKTTNPSNKGLLVLICTAFQLLAIPPALLYLAALRQFWHVLGAAAAWLLHWAAYVSGRPCKTRAALLGKGPAAAGMPCAQSAQQQQQQQQQELQQQQSQQQQSPSFLAAAAAAESVGQAQQEGAVEQRGGLLMGRTVRVKGPAVAEAALAARRVCMADMEGQASTLKALAAELQARVAALQAPRAGLGEAELQAKEPGLLFRGACAATGPEVAAMRAVGGAVLQENAELHGLAERMAWEIPELWHRLQASHAARPPAGTPAHLLLGGPSLAAPASPSTAPSPTAATATPAAAAAASQPTGSSSSAALAPDGGGSQQTQAAGHPPQLPPTPPPGTASSSWDAAQPALRAAQGLAEPASEWRYYMDRQLSDLHARMQQLQQELQMGSHSLQVAHRVPSKFCLQEFTEGQLPPTLAHPLPEPHSSPPPLSSLQSVLHAKANQKEAQGPHQQQHQQQQQQQHMQATPSSPTATPVCLSMLECAQHHASMSPSPPHPTSIKGGPCHTSNRPPSPQPTPSRTTPCPATPPYSPQHTGSGSEPCHTTPQPAAAAAAGTPEVGQKQGWDGPMPAGMGSSPHLPPPPAAALVAQHSGSCQTRQGGVRDTRRVSSAEGRCAQGTTTPLRVASACPHSSRCRRMLRHTLSSRSSSSVCSSSSSSSSSSGSEHDPRDGSLMPVPSAVLLLHSLEEGALLARNTQQQQQQQQQRNQQAQPAPSQPYLMARPSRIPHPPTMHMALQHPAHDNPLFRHHSHAPHPPSTHSHHSSSHSSTHTQAQRGDGGGGNSYTGCGSGSGSGAAPCQSQSGPSGPHPLPDPSLPSPIPGAQAHSSPRKGANSSPATAAAAAAAAASTAASPSPSTLRHSSTMSASSLRSSNSSTAPAISPSPSTLRRSSSTTASSSTPSSAAAARAGSASVGSVSGSVAGLDAHSNIKVPRGSLDRGIKWRP